MTRVGDFQTYNSHVSNDQVWDRVHVVLSQWDLSSDYTRHAGATILSLLVNCSLPVTVHIFHSEQQALKNPEEYHKNVQRYVEIIEKYSGELQLHDIIIPSWVTEENRPRVQTITPAALFRLYIPTILRDVSSAIYLDCDMVVNTDLSQLQYLPLDNITIAACLDSGRHLLVNNMFNNGIYQKIGVSCDMYFNSGFMLMNLDKLREINCLPDRALNFLRDHPELPCLDQEALNWLFQRDIFHLDPKYNVTVGGSSECTEYVQSLRLNQYDDCVLHFTGRDKPWKCYVSDADLYYWYYLLLTPWGKDEHSFFGYMNRAFSTRSESILHVPYWILDYSFKDTLKFTFYLIGHTIGNLICYYTKEILGKLKR